MGTGPGARCDAGRDGVRSALVSHGAGAVRAVRPLRRAAVDARAVLRDRRRRHRHHRPQCAETRADDAGPRSPALDSLRRERGCDGLDRVRNHLGLPGVRTRADAAPRTADDSRDPRSRASAGRSGDRRQSRRPGVGGVTLEDLTYFAGASLFVFGSGLAIVPFLYGGVVQQFHWLTERQFIDAVAVSMITPGPVVITVAFIGYLVAGLAGATLAAIGVFLPVYLITIFLAPYFHRVAKNQDVKAFVDGVTAAATGAIAGAAVILGRRALMDGPTILIALVTLALLLVPKKIPEPVLILAAGIVGLVLKGMW